MSPQRRRTSGLMEYFSRRFRNWLFQISTLFTGDFSKRSVIDISQQDPAYQQWKWKSVKLRPFFWGILGSDTTLKFWCKYGGCVRTYLLPLCKSCLLSIIKLEGLIKPYLILYTNPHKQDLIKDCCPKTFPEGLIKPYLILYKALKKQDLSKRILSKNSSLKLKRENLHLW